MIIVIILAVVTTVSGINEVCPGGSYSCPDYATCCQLADMSYGCCPMKKAVCCDDHIHCCPENTKCMAGTCIQLNGANVTSFKLSLKPNDVQCFGSHFICPDNATCCKGYGSGSYGCCGLKNAVCCQDGYHCCPENTICNLKSESCIDNGFISKMYDFRKTNILGSSNYTKLRKTNASNIICPDYSSQCPNDYTCCKLPSGEWGCCPFSKATCCKDHLHCCPQNLRCDNTSSTCSQGLMSISSSPKIHAKPIDVGLVCPDNTTCLFESMTCCRTSGQSFACCPYQDATCCDDGAHCCPNGFICDDVAKACLPRLKSQSKLLFKYIKKLN